INAIGHVVSRAKVATIGLGLQIHSFGAVLKRIKRYQLAMLINQFDIAIGTMGSALSTTHAFLLVNDHGARFIVIVAGDGIPMADHAQRIMAMAAGAGYQVIVNPQPVADEASRSVMGLFAG